MLPPKEMNTTCLRCGAPQDASEVLCGACGANREIELEIAAQLRPAMATLRRWLVVVAALLIISSLLVYQHINQHFPDASMPMSVYSAAGIGVLFLVLAAAAGQFPFACGAVAFGLFLCHWGTFVMEDAGAAFTPNLGLVLRVVSFVILLDAVRAGRNARRLRTQGRDSIPAARIHAGPTR